MAPLNNEDLPDLKAATPSSCDDDLDDEEEDEVTDENEAQEERRRRRKREGKGERIRKPQILAELVELSFLKSFL